MDLVLEDKLIRDGRVAILYSPGFGAGWSTWNTEYPNIVFDPFIADLLDNDVENWFEKASAYCAVKYPEAYLGGMGTLQVEWVPVGTQFRIDDYDGSESIEYRDATDWLVA